MQTRHPKRIRQISLSAFNDTTVDILGNDINGTV